MAEIWMPGATIMDVGDHAPTDGGPAKAIGHITWDDNGTASHPLPLAPYEDLQSYFGRNPSGKGAAPHILWDPFTGRFTQFVPSNSRSKSLVDQPGGTRTNRAGSVVIQVEALFFPYCKVDGKVYATLADTPCKGWPELNAWIRSHGVLDVWPMGQPNGFKSRRDNGVWASQSGWFAHGDVPENDHTDPGSWPAFTSSVPTTKPTIDLSLLIQASRTDPPKKGTPVSYPATKLVEQALVKEGLLAGSLADGHFGTATKDAYKKWQLRLGYTGSDADGEPGRSSLTQLGNRYGFRVVE